MTTRDEPRTAPVSTAATLFRRVLVGVDGTPASLEACRQIVRLATPETGIEAATVTFIGETALAGPEAPRLAEAVEREAEAALAAAVAVFPGPVESRHLHGFVTQALRNRAETSGATLLALGTHGHRRATEILIGGPLGELLHDAPCSIYVARAAAEPDRFPRSIVAGCDGSGPSFAALDAAEQLAARRHVPLRVVTAVRGKGVDLAAVQARARHAEIGEARPVEALVAAAADADLLVVGSRGLHGLRALGSVSERVAHEASSSVLVVR